MRIGSVFSGTGALELGLEWAGFGPTVWQIETDPWCRRVLKARFPDAQRYADVRAVDPAELDPIDLLCGGFPCQDVSAAGAGAGLDGDRSGLWVEQRRIIEGCAPRWVVVENVASGAVRWVDAVTRDLERLGYATLPIPLAAADVGAPHLRRRVFLVGRRRLGDAGIKRPQRATNAPQRAGRITGASSGALVDADGVGRQGSARHEDPGRPGAGARCPDVANAQRGELRLEWQRLPGRQPHALRSPGNAEPRDDRQDLADADGERWKGVRQPEHREQRGASWSESDGCGTDGPGWGAGRWPPAPSDVHAWGRVPAASQPAVCRVAYGAPKGLDRRRLKGLGNGVVPQCTQVVGEVIWLFEGRFLGKDLPSFEPVRTAALFAAEEKGQPARQLVQERRYQGVTVRLERVSCGKPTCRCQRGLLHGPYWYAYRWWRGRVVSRYIGKHLRPLPKSWQQKRKGSNATCRGVEDSEGT